MMMRWLQIFKHKGSNFQTSSTSNGIFNIRSYFTNLGKIELVLAILSGVLVGTSYIPFPPWAILFCYTPLWLIAINQKASLKNVFAYSWVTQFVLSLIGFYWIAYTAHEFGQIPWVLSILALLVFCALMHLYIPAAVTLGVFLKNKFSLSKGQGLLVIGLLHSLIERIWPSIFQWNLGYTLLPAKIPAYQLADLIGFEGLSAIIMICNAWLGYIWIEKDNLKNALINLACFVILCCTLIFWGANHVKPWNLFTNEIRATVIQANIGNLEKVYAEQGRGYQESITHRFTSLSKRAFEQFPDTDIFIWPETAFPDFLDQHLLGRKHTNILAAEMGPMGKPFITGAYSKDPHSDPRNDQSTYNALFLVGPNGENYDRPYRKTHLLAFGEYLPLSERFPILLKLLPFISNFGRGRGPDVMIWRNNGNLIQWGGQICYEGLYPGFTRGLAEAGTDIIVNTTNDSWFGMGSEPYEHLYMTLGRAIEIRRPLVRSTNTGISTAILANGEIQQQSPLHQEWTGQFRIKYLINAPTTFYVKLGHFDWVLVLGLLILIISTGAINARSRRP